MIDIKSGKDEVEAPIVLPPRLRRGPRREGRGPAPRHRDHRGPQRAPAGAGPRRRPHRPGGQRLLRLLGVRRRRRPPTSGAGTSTGSCGCARPRSATRRRTSPATPRSPRTRRSPRRSRIWDDDQRPQPRAERAAHPRPRHAGAAQGPPTTRCATCGSASSEPPALEAPEVLRHQRHRLEAEPRVDADHLRVDLGVLGDHLGRVRAARAAARRRLATLTAAPSRCPRWSRCTSVPTARARVPCGRTSRSLCATACRPGPRGCAARCARPCGRGPASCRKPRG